MPDRPNSIYVCGESSFMSCLLPCANVLLEVFAPLFAFNVLNCFLRWFDDSDMFSITRFFPCFVLSYLLFADFTIALVEFVVGAIPIVGVEAAN